MVTHPPYTARLAGMDLAIVTGIFTILGGLAGAALTWLQQSVASRQADRAQAQDLFVQLAKAIGTMETCT